jgi:hypothetical protein
MSKKQYPAPRRLRLLPNPGEVLAVAEAVKVVSIVGGIALGVGSIILARKYFMDSPKVMSIFSVPTLALGGGGYLFARSRGFDKGDSVAAALVTGAVGWGIQYYLLANLLDVRVAQKAAEAQQAAHDAQFTWYNPFTWVSA